MVMDQFGEKVPVPSNSSKTIQFVREEKLSNAVPAQLVEGIAPDAQGITLNQFQAVMEQYGSLIRLSDLAELTADLKFGGIISKYLGTPKGYFN